MAPVIIFIAVMSKMLLEVMPMVASIMVEVPMHNGDVKGPGWGNPDMTWRIVTLDIPPSAWVVIRHSFIHYHRRWLYHYGAHSFMTRYYTPCQTQGRQNAN